MKLKTIVTLLALTVSAGCATQGDSRLAWDIKPLLDVRHGMVYAMAYYQLGRFHQSQGRTSAAEAAFEKALAADPNNADALNALGTLYAERGQLAMSVEMFRKVTELAPATAYLHNNIGYALYLQGRFTEATESLQKAVRLDPNYERAWVNLEKAAREGGMLALADQAARQSLRSGEAASPARLATTNAAANTAAGKIASPEAPLTLTLALGSPGTSPAGAPPLSSLAAESIHAVPARIEAVALQGKSATAITLTEVAFEPATPAPSTAHPMQTAGTERILRVLASAVSSSAKAPVLSGLAPDSKLESARLEVANGNGVSRFATRFSGQLRAAGVGVDRITNYSSFAQGTSVIEYRAGFAEAAQALRERLGVDVELVQTRVPRHGTDVRLILGRDLLSTPQTRV